MAFEKYIKEIKINGIKLLRETDIIFYQSFPIKTVGQSRYFVNDVEVIMWDYNEKNQKLEIIFLPEVQKNLK